MSEFPLLGGATRRVEVLGFIIKITISSAESDWLIQHPIFPQYSKMLLLDNSSLNEIQRLWLFLDSRELIIYSFFWTSAF